MARRSLSTLMQANKRLQPTAHSWCDVWVCFVRIGAPHLAGFALFGAAAEPRHCTKKKAQEKLNL